jgi:hypothetical protein
LTTSITPQQLAKKLILLLGAGEGDSIELSQLRGGGLLLRKAIQGQGDQ